VISIAFWTWRTPEHPESGETCWCFRWFRFTNQNPAVRFILDHPGSIWIRGFRKRLDRPHNFHPVPSAVHFWVIQCYPSFQDRPQDSRMGLEYPNVEKKNWPVSSVSPNFDLWIWITKLPGDPNKKFCGSLDFSEMGDLPGFFQGYPSVKPSVTHSLKRAPEDPSDCWIHIGKTCVLVTNHPWFFTWVFHMCMEIQHESTTLVFHQLHQVKPCMVLPWLHTDVSVWKNNHQIPWFRT